MKDLLKNIWNTIRQHKIVFMLFIFSILLVIFDLSINFDIVKCITYVIMLIIVFISMLFCIKIINISEKIDIKNNIDIKLKNTSDRIKDLIVDFQAYVINNPNSYIKSFEIRYNENNDIFIFYENKLMSITNFCNMFINSKNIEASKYSKAILQLLAEKK